MAEEDVVINREQLDEIQTEARKYRALEVLGVDNWIGYDDAMELAKVEDI